jgi:L-2,4-diaminobutyrate decarboxylase
MATIQDPAFFAPAVPLPSRDEGAFPRDLFAGTREGLDLLARLCATAFGALRASRRTGGPLPAGQPAEVLHAVEAVLGPPSLPSSGLGSELALARLGRALGSHGIDLAHRHAAAHLQPPPLAVAVAADALATASNASVDTYDSGPVAIAIERWVVRALADLAGLGPHADGVLTPGGSLSNLMGLLLARDAAARRLGIDVRSEGLGQLPVPVVFCSEAAHFSVHRACAALGLGENAVRHVPVDRHHRLRPDALADMIARLGPGELPVAIVGTAGTTDFGSIDPLPALAELAAATGVWLHVDAAYGFGALFSEQLAPRLAGLGRADSITLDMHKLGWQPAAASVLLVSRPQCFAALAREVAYLNPEDDAAVGLDGLLGRSLQTTRRPDAMKIAASFLSHGRRAFGAWIDRCHALACHAEGRIQRLPELELVAPATLTTVVFRFRNAHDADGGRRDDELNAGIRRLLLERGTALIGRTRVVLEAADAHESEPRVCLKLTLLNPLATVTDIDELLTAVVRVGEELVRQESWV